MSRTLTATDATPTPMFRRAQDGAIEKVEPRREDYVTPARGTRCRLELCGISEEFEMESAFEPGKQVPKVRVEFLVRKGSGNAGKMIEGKRFTELYTWKVHPKSNFGKLVGALRGTPIAPGESIDPDVFIGTSFVTSTTLNDAGTYAGISVEAIDGGSVELPEAARADAPGPAADDGDDGDDPFANDDL